MESVITRITRGSKAFTRATKRAAISPASKMALRMKKLPVRKAAERKPDSAQVSDLRRYPPPDPRRRQQQQQERAASAVTSAIRAVR